MKRVPRVKPKQIKIRAADAKEVGVGNPAEETYCHPNGLNVRFFELLSTRPSRLSVGVRRDSQCHGLTACA
jgi:hypothetical protein